MTAHRCAHWPCCGGCARCAVNRRREAQVSAEALADAERLLRNDLELTAAHWREPSLDIWEEELGHHYFTLRVSAAALNAGAEWLRAAGEPEAAALRAEAQAIRETLDGYWLPHEAYYRSRIMPPGVTSTKLLDIAVILAAVHAGDDDETHSARDARMHATLEKLERLFDRLYPINHDRPRERAPALGRYEGDVYFSGGAYYFSTLGAAEFCFLAAGADADAARSATRGSRTATRSSKPFAPSRRRAATFPSSSISAPASKRPRSTSPGATPLSSRA